MPKNRKCTAVEKKKNILH